ncbi:hypothetical protein SAMN04487895_11965 [Paenibacillus sophorae]|uniref:Uncharacterized protein n=1 Tax=Paenibacillus sophorae TaxID=1333845 RepID=A0A1H8UVX9_9BACL|nr:hypothetical protein SAMN04487895_11965 [Paenibacillus sophorae]
MTPAIIKSHTAQKGLCGICSNGGQLERRNDGALVFIFYKLLGFRGSQRGSQLLDRALVLVLRTGDKQIRIWGIFVKYFLKVIVYFITILEALAELFIAVTEDFGQSFAYHFKSLAQILQMLVQILKLDFIVQALMPLP